MVIAASHSERVRALREVGFPDSRVMVIPNSIDFSEAPAFAPGPGDGSPVVLTVGRFSYQKNPAMFVRVARLIADRRPDVRFEMLGAGFQGPLSLRIRRMVTDMGLEGRLRILPWASKQESLEAIARATVFVLTSRFEGMPNTLLEALMLGTPAVVTDVDGSRDVVAGGSGGIAVPLDDDQAMVERVLGFVDDPRMARRIGEAGRVRARQVFDVHRNISALETAYERLLAG
jgi:glycosyltransferase involved in cell wall biosynthesis